MDRLEFIQVTASDNGGDKHVLISLSAIDVIEEVSEGKLSMVITRSGRGYIVKMPLAQIASKLRTI